MIDGGHDAAVKILDIALLELSISLTGTSSAELKFITEDLHDATSPSSGDREDRA